MGGKIAPHSIAKDLGAEVLLQHAQHRRALLIGEDVEHGLRVLRGHDLELDRAAGPKPVRQERRGPRGPEAVPAAPGRLPRVHRHDFHEGGEGLVQPESVPPGHRHQIAEPHVGDLVDHDIRDRSRSPRVAARSSTKRAVSRKVMAPRFSMAPKAKSGMAIRSNFSPGYGIP